MMLFCLVIIKMIKANRQYSILLVRQKLNTTAIKQGRRVIINKHILLASKDEEKLFINRQIEARFKAKKRAGNELLID